jgi:hypothetical protein
MPVLMMVVWDGLACVCLQLRPEPPSSAYAFSIDLDISPSATRSSSATSSSTPAPNSAPTAAVGTSGASASGAVPPALTRVGLLKDPSGTVRVQLEAARSQGVPSVLVKEVPGEEATWASAM